MAVEVYTVVGVGVGIDSGIVVAEAEEDIVCSVVAAMVLQVLADMDFEVGS